MQRCIGTFGTHRIHCYVALSPRGPHALFGERSIGATCVDQIVVSPRVKDLLVLRRGPGLPKVSIAAKWFPNRSFGNVIAFARGEGHALAYPSGSSNRDHSATGRSRAIVNAMVKHG